MEVKQFGFSIELNEEELSNDACLRLLQREGETLTETYRRFCCTAVSRCNSSSLLETNADKS